MNIFQKSIISISILSAFVFAGCQDPVNSPSQETVTVFFYNGGSTPFSKKLNKGSTLPSVNTDYVTPSTHHFLYWSTSRASSTAALQGKIDSNTPITQDMILYGIYAPVISSEKAPVVDLGQLKLKVYYDTNNLFTFNNNESECALNLSSVLKNGETVINTAAITTQFSKKNLNTESGLYCAQVDLVIPYLPNGTFDLYITNGFETIKATKDDNTDAQITVSGVPAAATSQNVAVDDSYAKVTWTSVLGSTYTVNAKDGETIVATKTGCNNSAEFYGLTNDTTYTFDIITENTGNTEYKTTDTGTPAITRQTVDWVLAMYMDGDNDLHDALFRDMNEVEYGLWLIRNSGVNVKAVALWDGWVGDTAKKPFYTIAGSGSCLYELGPEESTKQEINGSYYGNQVIGDTYSEYLVFNNLSLGPETKNLSYTARDWLLNNQDINTVTKTSCGEVNMGSKETLINYINWVKARYAPTEGIILQFSDHGGGPRNAPGYAILPNGTTVNIGDNDTRKALCWDEGSDSAFLKTNDVSDALSTISTTGLKSISSNSLILMDVCLGASLEDAYQFKDYADYMVASPSTIPGYGLNYIRLMQAFTSSATMESIGKQIISDYAKFYEHYGWDSLANSAYKKTYAALTDQEKEILDKKWAGFFGVTTLTLIDLSKIGTVAEKIFALADKLNALDSTSNKEYLLNFRKDNVSLLEQNYSDTSLTYKGSYNFLYDTGRLTDAILMDSSTNPSGINDAATAVKTALKDAIISSWRDTWLQNKSGDNAASMYSFLHNNSQAGSSAESYDFADNYYGLTIAGYAYVISDNKYVVPGQLMQWYVNDLAFGSNEKWIDFLLKIKDLQ